MSNNISRRTFIKATLAGAVGLALPNMRAHAEEDSYTYADTINWAGEYDVIVMGFGGAGAVAANYAAKTSDSVLLFDVAPKGHEGGNTRYCGQFVVCGDDRDKLLTYYRTLGAGYDVDDELLTVFTEKLVSLPDDMNKEYDLPDMMFWRGIPATAWAIPEYPEFEGSETINSFTFHRGYSDGAVWQTVRNKVVNQPDRIDILYETRGRKLIQDPDSKTILGVCVERNGELINIRAKNGVVMTCGGFENNPTMIANYLSLSKSNPIGTLYNRGDGIKMALDVNADLWHMDCHEGQCTDCIGSLGFDVGEGKRGSIIREFAAGGSYIVVSEDGTRFMNETELCRHGHNYYYGEHMIPPFTTYSYVIADEKMMQTWKENGLPNDDMKSVMTEASSFEELAEILSLPKLVRNISFYNDSVSAGEDFVFNRTPETMAALDDGHCYAFRMVPRILNTQGGARRNCRAEVLDVDGNPIPHLYSAGEFGGLTAHNYQGATNIAECLIFGRIAGENAAAKKDELPVYQMHKKVSSDLVYTLGATDEIAESFDTTANEYIGKGSGIGGDVVVKCRIEDGKITNIEIISQSETEGIGSRAIEAIPAQFIGCSSIDEINEIDGVSGASITSNALKAAVIDCLTQSMA